MLLAHHQPLVTCGKDSRAGFLVENAEQSHAETKGVFGCDFLAAELAEALNQFLLALVREGINFTGLAALSGGPALPDPAVVHEPAKQWVYQVVVQLVAAGDKTHLLLKGIAMFGAVEKVGEQD